MSFLQPTLLLAALPIIALPVIIHLINQRRYQTVRWGAMMFLLAANRMSSGYARIRQYLILAMRMLALAGLAFVIGRPLTGGWLGMAAGGRAETNILILDRSPSMEQAGTGSGVTKLEAGRRQLVQTLEMIGKSRWVLIDSAAGKPRELESIDALLTAPDTGPTGAPSDLPAMLQTARDYIDANRAGQADIWICSDLRENDWDPEGGRWQTVRDAFGEFTQRARFHLLAYAQATPGNQAVRVTGIKRQESGDGVELLVSLRIAREGKADAPVSIPVQFEIDGARSEVAVELAGRDAELKDYRVVLEKGRGRGWGKVSIPADANPADNFFWFAFDRPKPRRTVVVTETPELARPLELAAAITPDPSVQCSSEVIGIDALTGVEWEKVSLLLWQAPLPEGEAAALVRSFVDRGGRVLFFPPRIPTATGFAGVRWTEWAPGTPGAAAVDGWRSDTDLLAQTQSGAPLPVGQLEVRKYCRLDGETTALATLKGGAPLLARAATTRGGVYFCSTGASPADSSLATGGVVFYVLVQRALADGAGVIEAIKQVAAGDPGGDDPKQWKRLAGDDSVIATDYAAQPGIYEAGERLLAVNRPAAEDLAPVVAPTKVADLFKGLDFTRVDDTSDDSNSLVQEIWRLFLFGMMGAMVIEAGLCLPKRTRLAPGVRT